ncbi:MAG: hypothetical protein ACLQUY_16915 [Ktedonobacterales bacterium]
MGEWFDKQQILFYVARCGIPVEGTSFDDWKSQHLLPTPVRNPEHTGRGRPRYLYPEIACTAVLWLGKHRSHIDGEDIAKVWMWLEGFDYIQVDVRAVVLARMQALWEQAQREAMPSLPDMATVTEQGIPDDLSEQLLDELDVHITSPQIESGRWTQSQTGIATFLAVFTGLLPSSDLTDVPAVVELQTEDGIPLNAILTPEAAEWRSTLMQGISNVIVSGHIVRLYRFVEQYGSLPEDLRAMWQMITPDTIRGLWPMFAMFSPFRTEKPKSRDDFMRLLYYDLFHLVLLASTLALASDALRSPQSEASNNLNS